MRATLRVLLTLMAGGLLTFLATRWLPPVRCDVMRSVLARCEWADHHYATLRRDLRAIRDLQELHRESFSTYTARVEDLTFIPSPDVYIELSASADSWSATALHGTTYVLQQGCAIYWGGGVPIPALMADQGVAAGEIFCSR